MSFSAPILELGSDFYDPVEPAHFPKAILRYTNPMALDTIQRAVQLQNLSSEDLKKHFWNFSPLPQQLEKPLALRYHGHQFRHYNPDLGDGRGFLFAQIHAHEKLLDLATKGSGTTPYSRRGDGRLTLKGALREALATELLESLGVNTSKTLIFFETGENLERNDEPSPTRSAVLTRMSHSHIRFGTFQRLATLNQPQNILKLVDYSLKHYFPELEKNLKSSSNKEKVETFFTTVSEKSADLVAQVMIAGFVHGVLNTDNLNITGELFDYGPYRFLPEYDPTFTAAYFDHQGLYCYGRQPSTFLWNLEQLSLALQVGVPDAQFTETLENFGYVFNQSLYKYISRRLNVHSTRDHGWIEQLVVFLFDFMSKENVLFEQTFFDLHSGITNKLERSLQSEIYHKPSFKNLKEHLKKAEILHPNRMNEAYFQQRTTPETLLKPEIEIIWEKIDKEDDWTLFNEKIERLRSFRGIYS